MKNEHICNLWLLSQEIIDTHFDFNDSKLNSQGPCVDLLNMCMCNFIFFFFIKLLCILIYMKVAINRSIHFMVVLLLLLLCFFILEIFFVHTYIIFVLFNNLSVFLLWPQEILTHFVSQPSIMHAKQPLVWDDYRNIIACSPPGKRIFIYLKKIKFASQKLNFSILFLAKKIV